MPLVSLDHVNLAFAGEPILADVSLQIHRGDRVVVVGRNGAGKTSLLNLIAGDLRPDAGAVTVERGARLGYLRQVPDLQEGGTVFETALAGRSELLQLRRRLDDLTEAAEAGDERLVASLGEMQERYDREGGDDLERRCGLALESVGFAREQFDQSTELLSGGERSRLLLARILLMDADLLLLDEPTNHLDIRGTEFLERFLRSFPGGAIVVSHDRAFFDRFATSLASIEVDGSLGTYPGSYQRYQELYAQRIERLRKEVEQQREAIERSEEFIRRTHAGQKATQAKSRQKQLDRIERLAAPPSAEGTLGLRFQEVEHSGKVVFQAKELVLRPGGQTLLDRASFAIGRGERVGVIGPNGCGKTTLLKTLAAQLEPESGRVQQGFRALIGFYDQGLSGLTTGRSVLEELAAARPDLGEQALRDLAARFLFRGDDVLRRVETFSGGEQSRLALALLVLGKHNTLLLDEPTNHLDLPSREVLEEALAAFPGTVVAVSHDRAFLDRTVRRILSFEGRALVDALGTYSELRTAGRILHNLPEEEESREPDPGKQRRREAYEERRTAQRARETLQKRLVELEQQIGEQETGLEALTGRMHDPSMAHDWEGLERLQHEKHELDAAHERTLTEWDRVQSELRATPEDSGED